MIDYAEINYQEVTQISKGKLGFAKIKFVDLNDVVRFTARTEEKTDPFLSDIEKQIVVNENLGFYQRIVNDSRTYNIQQYIIKEAIKEYRFNKGFSKTTSLGLFPTSTLIAVNIYEADSKENYEREYYELERKDENQVYLCYQEGQTLYLPKNNKVALIVDGQHRSAALRALLLKLNPSLKVGKKKLDDLVDSEFYNFIRDRINNFEFLCTVLIDFNLYEQGEIFASVNFNQKPVNRSLYFDIFGASPNTERNELKLSHELVKHLNNSNDSVLKGFIDMLGTGDGIVSQSAVMESLMKLFGKNKCWHLIYMDYRSDGDKYKNIGQFLRLYFAQIKETFKKYWPQDGIYRRNEYSHILIKTTGMGAFIRLINIIYPYIYNDSNINKEKVELELKNLFERIATKGDYYFDNNSSFVKGGGQGLQSKLYKQISSDLGFPS